MIQGAVLLVLCVYTHAGYAEEQLRSLFQLCGNVAESRVVHDKQSGRPVGYGYVSFFTKEAADLAISTFDDQITLQVCALSSGTHCCVHLCVWGMLVCVMRIAPWGQAQHSACVCATAAGCGQPPERVLCQEAA